MTTFNMGARGASADAELTHADVVRLFDDGYREVEILPDGTIREASGSDGVDEDVTRTLKTKRTWY